MTELLRDIYQLFRQSIIDFSRNQGYLLSGTLAYYILLSIVPLLLLSLIVLANFIDEATLIHLLELQLNMIFPSATDYAIEQIRQAYRSRGLFGGMGILSLLVLGSLVFRTWQKIMKVFFGMDERPLHRHIVISFIVPNMFVIVFLLLTLLLTLLDGAIATLQMQNFTLFAQSFDFSPYLPETVKLFSSLANLLLLVLFYKIMPMVKIRWKHAIIGAMTAGVLWLLIKQVLIYYYSHFSSVSMIFGAMSSLFILLISLEVLSLLLLFGAQVIATYRESSRSDTSESRPSSVQ
ncbi:MAG: YihY family inner membrane protein [Gammaproteobacteria bacterium]|nr:YihY family inner membrane protein [Gammaproteobacteria bacterium]